MNIQNWETENSLVAYQKMRANYLRYCARWHIFRAILCISCFCVTIAAAVAGAILREPKVLLTGLSLSFIQGLAWVIVADITRIRESRGPRTWLGRIRDLNLKYSQATLLVQMLTAIREHNLQELSHLLSRIHKQEEGFKNLPLVRDIQSYGRKVIVFSLRRDDSYNHYAYRE